MSEEVSDEQAEQLVELARIGDYALDARPNAIACLICGDILWDIAKHYRFFHPHVAEGVLGEADAAESS